MSLTTLRKWRRNKFQRKRSASPLQAGLVREAREAAERVGLPPDAIRDLEAKISAMSDGDLVVSATRRLLIAAGLLLELARAMAPELMRFDPCGLAALYIAASRMTKGAHASMTEARNLAERSMKAKCALLLPGPHDADRDGDRSVTDRLADSERRDSDRRPFADLLARFGAVPQ